MKLTLKNLPNLKYKKMKSNGFKRIEYILGGGGAVIDTGIHDTADIIFDTKYSFTIQNPSFAGYIACGYGRNTGCVKNAIWNWYPMYNSIHYSSKSSGFIDRPTFSNDSVFLEIQQEKYDDTHIKYTFGGVTKILDKRPFIESPEFANLILFGFADARIVDNKAYRAFSSTNAVKMYYFRIKDWNTGTCIADFVPVIRDDGEYGMYDLISEKFFGNANQNTTNKLDGGQIIEDEVGFNDISINTGAVNSLESIQINNCNNIDTVDLLEQIADSCDSRGSNNIKINVDLKHDQNNRYVGKTQQLSTIINTYDGLNTEKPELNGNFFINETIPNDMMNISSSIGGNFTISARNTVDVKNSIVQTLDSELSNYNPALALMFYKLGFGKIYNDYYKHDGSFILSPNDYPDAQFRIKDEMFNGTTISAIVDADGIVNSEKTSYYPVDLTKLSACTFLSSIGNYFIYNCKTISSVALPSTLISLGTAAFQNCTGISSILILPESLKTIGANAFMTTNNLSILDVPKSVEYIGGGAFQGCAGSRIENLDLPLLSAMGGNAFYYNAYLKHINLPKLIRLEGSQHFRDCTSLLDANLGTQISATTTFQFYDCTSLTSVSGYANVKLLGGSDFYNCQKLKYIDSLSNVISCAYGSANEFYNCYALEHIDMRSLTSLYGLNFYNCHNLKDINITNSISGSCNNIFNGCRNLTSIGEFNFANITEIKGSGFYECSSLNLPVKSNSVSAFGGSYMIHLANIKYIDLPNCTKLMGGSWNLYQVNGPSSSYGKLHMRFGAVNEIEGFQNQASWYTVITGDLSNMNVGVILINRKRSDFISYIRNLPNTTNTHKDDNVFKSYELQHHCIFNDDPEWTTWNNWFDGGCILEQVPQFPLNR